MMTMTMTCTIDSILWSWTFIHLLLQRFRRHDVRETVTTSIFKISCHYSEMWCIILGRQFSSCFRLSEETWKLPNSLSCSYWRVKIIFRGPSQSWLKLDKNNGHSIFAHIFNVTRYIFDGTKIVWNRRRSEGSLTFWRRIFFFKFEHTLYLKCQ